MVQLRHPAARGVRKETLLQEITRAVTPAGGFAFSVPPVWDSRNR
jgi:hypothetical protein